MRRLRRMLWRYGGGSYEDRAFEVSFPVMFSNLERDFEESLYERVSYIARYLRQKMSWVWKLDEEEARLYETAIIKIIKAENGKLESANPLVPKSPFGFGDYDGGG